MWCFRIHNTQFVKMVGDNSFRLNTITHMIAEDILFFLCTRKKPVLVQLKLVAKKYQTFILVKL